MAKREHRILGWRGILADAPRIVRIMAFTALTVFAVSFVFVDLGFVGIGMPGDYVGYAMTLLAFISLAALLYGILAGGALGLISGVALFIHSKTLPLGFYELLFISEFSSIIALTFVGLLLGWTFAIALRKNPQGIKRGIYICICCFSLPSRLACSSR